VRDKDRRCAISSPERNAGVCFINNKGYRLEKSDVLSAEGIQLALWPQTPPLTITVLETSESTMTDAKRAILDQTPDNTLIVADMLKAAFVAITPTECLLQKGHLISQGDTPYFAR
jgi:hypothetical protein